MDSSERPSLAEIFAVEQKPVLLPVEPAPKSLIVITIGFLSKLQDGN